MLRFKENTRKQTGKKEINYVMDIIANSECPVKPNVKGKKRLIDCYIKKKKN